MAWQDAHIANIAYALTELKRRPDLCQIVAKFIRRPEPKPKKRRSPTAAKDNGLFAASHRQPPDVLMGEEPRGEL